MRIIAVLFLITLLSGCQSRSDREPLMQFLHALEGAMKHNYDDQLRCFPEAERKIRWHVLFFRDHVVTIDDYLSKHPPLTDRSEKVVESVRQICVEEAQLYEGLLKEKRFQLTEVEQQRSKELQADYQRKLVIIGRMIDGKE